MCHSAHPAFDKAGHYFGVKIVRVDDGADFRASVSNMAKAITRNTIALVASAPSYPHGMIDDVPAIAKLATEKGLFCHVDGCLGGFVLPWIKLAGFEVPEFDFAVPGVSSMSCDTHKYGYGPKGLSVVLFRNKQLRKHMYFVTTEWPGGIYASAGVAGSRPGAPIAATWAVMVNLGKKGYVEAAKGIMECQRKIKEGMKDIPDMQLIGDSFSTVLGFTSKTVDSFMVADAMKKRKWVLDVLQKPNGFHICLTVRHIGKAETFLEDLKASVAEARDNPEAFKHGMAPIYGMAAELPDRSIVNDFVTGYLDAVLDTM
jgi:glutamate/tyrosine decarboxylase-like PLP-dependent enzyme